MAKVFKARIKSSGQIIEVYQHWSGDYVNYADCKTIYKKEQIQIIG